MYLLTMIDTNTKDIYASLLEESDMIACLANLSGAMKLMMPDTNWCGFYIVKEGMLVVGPFQGKPACTRIPFHKGMCGKCYREKRTLRIRNVLAEKDHIACDSESRSELCVPVIVEDEVKLLIDIDAPVENYFTDETEKSMEDLARAIARAYVLHAWN